MGQSDVLLFHRQDLHDIPYTSRYDVDVEVPRFQMPESGVDPKVAYQILHDELLLGELDLTLDTRTRLMQYRWEPQHEPCIVRID
jgi:hypothetical protein